MIVDLLLPPITLADLEVGPRAVLSLRNENRGLTTQRRQAITARYPDTDGWCFNYGSDGTVCSMSWSRGWVYA